MITRRHRIQLYEYLVEVGDLQSTKQALVEGTSCSSATDRASDEDEEDEDGKWVILPGTSGKCTSARY